MSGRGREGEGGRDTLTPSCPPALISANGLIFVVLTVNQPGPITRGRFQEIHS